MSPVDRDLVQEERIRQEAADRAAYRSMSHAAPRSRMDAGTKRLALFAGGLGALLVVVVGGWSLMGHHPTGIPVIEPPAGPIRVKPVDPGGMQVMGPQGPAPVEGAAQALAPGPEAPQPQALQAEVDAARHAAAPATAPVPTPASPDAKVSAPVPPAAASPPPPVKAAPASPPADTERTENVVPVPADPKPGVHAVQLAALESQSAAQAEWARLSRKAPSLFAHHTPAIAHVAHDGKSFYRLRTAGFDSSAAAASFCGQAKAQGIACTPAAF